MTNKCEYEQSLTKGIEDKGNTSKISDRMGLRGGGTRRDGTPYVNPIKTQTSY